MALECFYELYITFFIFIIIVPFCVQCADVCIEESTPKRSRKHKSHRKAGTTGGVKGHYYEIDLLILGKLRGERDLDEFYLDTNLSGVGAFDDVVFRYRNMHESKILLMQTKHAVSSNKSKITIEKFKNPESDDGKFYLGKYFLSYCKSQKKFSDSSTDPVFKGDFKELDVRYIIYTNSVLDDQFDRDRKTDIFDNIFSTTSKENKRHQEAFKFNQNFKNSDLITMLEHVSCEERIKLLAKDLVSCICGKLNQINMMSNKSFQIYHVFLAKNVIEVKEEIKEDEKKVKYREGKIKSNFLNFDSKNQFEKILQEEVLYGYAMDVVFSKKTSSELGSSSEQDDLVNKVAESLKSKTIDKDAIKKLGGSVIMLDTKERKLEFADQAKLKDENAKEFIKNLKTKVENLASYEIAIPYELIKEILVEQTDKEPLKLHLSFGNISPSFKKQKHLINQLIKLFEMYKSHKIIKIYDDTVDNGKVLTVGDIKNISKLVGNLLLYDQKKNILRLSNEESLDGNALKILQELKTAAQSSDLEVDDYRFDIKVKNFPRDSLFIDDEDTTNVTEFLNKLEIFTGQANEEELQEIIKAEMRNLYKLTDEEVEYNFLKIRDKSMKFWQQEKETFYLVKGDDFLTDIMRSNIEFDVTDPVYLFTGREEELDELHREIQCNSLNRLTVISQITSISGLGGIGKTQIAKRYVQKHGKDYDCRIWINAESEITLTESFRRLAKDKLRISTKDANGEDKRMKSVVADVYKFFKKRKSLFIFNDAEDYKSIKDFLPYSSYSDSEKPQILITSRNRNWEVEEVGEIKIISLKVFKPYEAEKFVKDFLKIKNDFHKKDIEELTKQLQYFPLALKQAAAYIKKEDEKLNKRGNERFKISDYLKKRQQLENKLSEENYYRISDNYTKTVLTTWTVTLEKICKDKKHGGQAIDILNIMAYFASDKLILKELFSLSNADEKWNAIELLHDYSMIDLQNGVADIHKLVQEVTRQNLKKENKEKEVLIKALKGIDNDNTSEESMNHIISVWYYASKYPKLVHEFCTICQYGSSKYTPVHLLVRGGKKEEMNRILNIRPEMKDIGNLFGETPLFEAIIKDYKEIIECLIEVHNVDPQSNVSANGHKPITVAAIFGKEDLVKYFVSKSAKVNSYIRYMFSTIDCAALSGNKSLIKYLIDEGAEINNNNGYGGILHEIINSARRYSVCEDDILEIIKLCLQKDHDLIKSVDFIGRTPLHAAVELGFLNVVETLISAGVNVNRCSFTLTIMETPGELIHYYANNGFRDCTALHIASQKNYTKICEVLLKNGAYYDFRNIRGKTPLHLAKPESDIMNLLSCIDHLFAAIQDNKKDEVHSLLKKRSYSTLKVILNARNSDGKTPLLAAVAIKNETIAKLIIEKLKSF